MGYKFFDKRYLIMPDDKDIVGKKVFYADHLDMLICDIESGDVSRNGVLDTMITDCSFPFYIDSSRWALVYYDPNYECKVAYSQGKQIQFRTYDGKWKKPLWSETDVYRIKPDTWYVHPSADEYGNCIGHPFYKDTSNKTFVAFEGTEEECDKWIEEHTPKSRRMTNKELARWLADREGQLLNDGFVCITYLYPEGSDDHTVLPFLRIREWDSKEWHEPVVEVKK